MSIKIRKARSNDSKQILRLINELAEFEKLPPPDKKAQKRLTKEAFSSNPSFRILVAEDKDLKALAGYAFYFFTYSTFRAKPSLYLEDIYIAENYRNKGIGKLFFEKMLEKARKKECGRMEWVVLDWNKNAINFYNKLGAAELKDWKYYRLEI